MGLAGTVDQAHELNPDELDCVMRCIVRLEGIPILGPIGIDTIKVTYCCVASQCKEEMWSTAGIHTRTVVGGQEDKRFPGNRLATIFCNGDVLFC